MPLSMITKNCLTLALTNVILLFCFLFHGTLCSSHIYQNTTLVDAFIHSKLITSLNQSVYYQDGVVNHSSINCLVLGTEQKSEYATVWEMISHTSLTITLVILTSITFICLMTGLLCLTLLHLKSVTRSSSSILLTENVELQSLVTQ
nr:hypothetical protein 3 [Hubei tombus-like virus 28]